MLRPPLLVGGLEYTPVSRYTVLEPAALSAKLQVGCICIGLGIELQSRSTGCGLPTYTWHQQNY